MSSNAKQTQANIEEHGWQVVVVPEDDEGPGFAYSIGLYRRFDHPEVIVFGLPIALLQGIVNAIGEQVRRGRRFADGGVADEVLEGYPVRFEAVSRAHHGEFLGHAIDFYGGEEFSFLQCYWPDSNGHFPGQPGCAEGCAASQPSLKGLPSAGNEATS
jgi:hypothetical protein